jgi:hypothetical protein
MQNVNAGLHRVPTRTVVLVLTKEPEKKIPSTAAKAMSLSAKVLRLSEIHLRAQLAFLAMQGTSRIARVSNSKLSGTGPYSLVSMASKR